MIFDTSSIYKAVEINCIEKLQGEKTLDLSLYELGNIVWKYVMRNKLSSDEGKKLIDILMDVISLMQIIETGINTTTYSIAVKNRISYYDASYIHA
ncbi:MAG: type II toxin-antitoxin system VapC family toxin, partial [Thermoplasmata archaeon]|nr:type II toxin-antitoxin system VapC family toxin [Thermoplasmata archaeon]